MWVRHPSYTKIDQYFGVLAPKFNKINQKSTYCKVTTFKMPTNTIDNLTPILPSGIYFNEFNSYSTYTILVFLSITFISSYTIINRVFSRIPKSRKDDKKT